MIVIIGQFLTIVHQALLDLQQGFFWNITQQFFAVLESISMGSDLATSEREYCERFLELVIDLLVCASIVVLCLCLYQLLL